MAFHYTYGRGFYEQYENDADFSVYGFDTINVDSTEDTRRDYREMLFSTKAAMRKNISGVILFDETIRQSTANGKQTLVELMQSTDSIPGIKVDAGAQTMAGFKGEKITEGLDGLRERLAEYAWFGARFAKWRAVITIGASIPSRGCIAANAHSLARYAALCQEAGLVPIVEPEVLVDGEHGLERCADVTAETLQAVFGALTAQRVLLEGMLLKPNMVLPGLAAADQSRIDAVADATVRCFLRSVPAAVPGIVFLSGGQSAELASARLNAMNLRFAGRLPWALSFSFARAIQQPALEIWRGEAANVLAAQQALRHRADSNRLARRGRYDPHTDAEVAATPAH